MQAAVIAGFGHFDYAFNAKERDYFIIKRLQNIEQGEMHGVYN